MIYIITNQLFTVEHSEIQKSTIQECLEYFKDIQEIELDTEATASNPLAVVQLGARGNQYVIDTSTVSVDFLKPLLHDDSKIFILMNAQYDLSIFLSYGIDIKNVFDIFLAECILTTGYVAEDRDLSLRGMCKNYLNVELDKDERGKINYKGFNNVDTIMYSASDVKYMKYIKEVQMEEIGNWDLINILELENKFVRVMAKMSHRGMYLDSNKWLEVNHVAKARVDELTKELDKIVYELGKDNSSGDNKITKYVNFYKQGNMFFEEDVRLSNINWKSPVQKKKFLHDLGFKVDSTMEDELIKISSKHRIIPLLIEYSKANKMISAFGEEFLKHINPNTKRIHPKYWQILSTGRLSMNHPNMQQIPARGEYAEAIRAAFLPTMGYKMVCADYSGFELAIIAAFSKDQEWIDLINSEGDLHGELCVKTFDMPMSAIREPFPLKPSLTYRDVQKILNFGIAYGMSEYKLSSTLYISIHEAKKILNKFKKAIPIVNSFLNILGTLGKSRGYIATPKPLRRIRWFKIDENTTPQDLASIERKSKNMPIQSTNANLIKKALVTLQDIIDRDKLDVYLLLSIHDEILSEAKEGIEEEWAKIKQEVMENVAKEYLETVYVRAKPKISDYWEK